MRRRKKVKTGKPSRRDLIKIADKLWSQIVLERDGRICQYTGCGKPGNNPHHWMSRKYLNTRHNPDIGITLCWAHHLHIAHGEPEKFRDFLIQRIGQAQFDRLKVSAYITGCKIDMQAVIVGLKEMGK